MTTSKLTAKMVQSAKPKDLSSTEYYIHKSLEIGKIFKIKFARLAVANCPAKIYRCLCSALHSL